MFTRVAGENFRLFERFELRPAEGVNLILGPNAAGKTTLLEAMFAVGRGRSFRAAAPELAGPAGPHWQVQGDVAARGVPARRLAVGWSASGAAIRTDGAETSMQDRLREVAVQVLEPDSHRLLEDGPVYRRRYLDWGVFHVEHRFFAAWRRYQRALKQRNHALRLRADADEIAAWNPELVEAGEEIHAQRQAHVLALHAPLVRILEALLPGCEWSLELSAGWPTGKSLAESLAEHLEQDRRQGVTAGGPHRAELKVRLAGRSAKHQASRGQQKLLIAALLLAQAALIAAHAGRPPILLVDDFPAELGPAFQARLLAQLAAYGGQVFVTAIERSAALENVDKNAMFHVEHGSVSGPSLV
jgi:DNA replication and repair protein RecF